MTKTTEITEKRAFQEGFMRVQQGKVAEVRRKLKVALGVTTNMALLNRMKGRYEHTPEQIEGIERVLTDAGVAPEHVWGKVEV